MLRDIFQLPEEHRANFLNLYWDIAWFGVLTGSTAAFISVYLVRIGGSAFQVGLLSAVPAVVTMVFALPAGRWLKNRDIDRVVFSTSVLFRMFYALFVPLPLLFSSSMQAWLVLSITLVMSVPGTALAVGFNALFALAVPAEWRGTVSGVRNALLAVTSTLASLLCGVILNHIPFPIGYQLVFGIGFLGAMMSSYHLYHVQVTPRPEGVGAGKSLGGLVNTGMFQSFVDVVRLTVGLRFLRRLNQFSLPRLKHLEHSFRWILLALFFFHMMQYTAIPLFPLFYVDQLGLTDQQISVGNGLFYTFIFLSSTQLARIIKRLGLHQATALGALLIGIFPILLAVSRNYEMYLFAMTAAGLVSSLNGVALSNYLLEIIPEKERSIYLAWYTLILNAGILSGSLLGPLLAREFGLGIALLGVAAGRVLAGLGIWVSGKNQPRVVHS